MKPTLYLDIDGVILTSRQELPNHLEEFLQFITINFDVYWLTTHCRGNENKTALYLSKFYPVHLLSFIEQIKPTEWDSLKTEAIDFSRKFLWLEDYPLESEKEILKVNNALSSLVLIDLKANSNALKDFIDNYNNPLSAKE